MSNAPETLPSNLVRNPAGPAYTWLLCLALSAFCIAMTTSARTAAERDLTGRSWSVGERRFVGKGELARAIAGADYVLLGEKHDNPAHHLGQAELIADIAASGRRPAVVLEMLNEDRQAAVTAYLSGGGNAAGFGDAVDWRNSGWPPYAIYRPVVEAALAAGLPVIAGNLPRATVQRIGQDGLAAGLPENRRHRLRLDRPLDAPTAEAMREEMFESHCRLMPRSAMNPFIAVQRARDAVMAAHMHDAALNGADGSILIAGNGHVRSDRGVPAYLRHLAPNGRIVTIAFLEADKKKSDPEAYAERFGGLPFDYLSFTVATEERDHCAELRRRWGQRGTGASEDKPGSAD